MTEKLTDREIAGIFRAIDKDGNGKITKQELSRFFKANKAKYTSKQIGAYITSIDKDGDGQVNLEELTAALRGCPKT
ncbi:EF hand [Opisthorchis viverrini]|uniref:Calcium-binding protein n=3 Tax=Opisthorchiidae TaxID=6196 RepID=G7YA44_CLOSI|nr:hypothetical protein CSKR_113281 [Clonorchis sinensis]OON16378.1 EF hand [Opisthorchis viverrini]GAA49828.1 calcium-binding protein [Clonorchis sinensis]